jgi:hypothetical protein
LLKEELRPSTTLKMQTIELKLRKASKLVLLLLVISKIKTGKMLPKEVFL